MNMHFLPQEGGCPLQATPDHTETVFGAAHNLPHSSCQEWYSGLISSLTCYESGCVPLGFRDDPEAAEQGFGAFIW